MLAKKTLLTFLLLLFGSTSVRTMQQEAPQYFLKYDQKEIPISENALNQSVQLKNWVEFRKKAFDNIISLDKLLKDTNLPNGKPFTTILTPNDIKNFVKLSQEAVVRGDQGHTNLKPYQLTKQIFLANRLKNDNVRTICAHALAYKIKTKDGYSDFLNNKGIIWETTYIGGKEWTITDILPKDILEHISKTELIKKAKVPFEVAIDTGKRLNVELSDFFAGAWSPKHDKIAYSFFGDTEIYIWDLNKPSERPEKLFGHSKIVSCIKWSPDEKKLASGSHDKNIIIWNISGWSLSPKKLRGHTDIITNIEWSPDGTKIASTAKDGTIKIWDSKTGTLLHPFGPVPKSSYISWAPDSKSLASGSDKTIYIWNLKSDKLEKKIPIKSSAYKIKWSRNGKHIFVLSDGGNILIINPTNGNLLKKIKTPATSNPVIQWSQDEKKIAYAQAHKRYISLFDFKTKKPLESLILPSKEKYKRENVTAITWSPNGNKIVSIHTNKVIKWHLDFFHNISFEQAVLLLALQAWHKQFPKKPFKISENKRIFEIVNKMDPKKVSLMQKLGWIQLPKSWKLKKSVKTIYKKVFPGISEKDSILIWKLEQELSQLNTIEQPFSEETLSTIENKIEKAKEAITSKKAKKKIAALASKISQATKAHRQAWLVKDIIKTANEKKFTYAKNLIEQIEKLGCIPLAATLENELKKKLLEVENVEKKKN